MDAFSAEPFGEVEIQKNGLLSVVGLTNGKLNQKVVVDSTTDNKPSFYGKVGVDKRLSDLRVTWAVDGSSPRISLQKTSM